MIEHLHPIGTPWWALRHYLIVINKCRGLAVLHGLLTWQDLMALLRAMSIHVMVSKAIGLEHARHSLLRVRIRLPLRVTVVCNGGQGTCSRIARGVILMNNCSTWRSLWQVSSVHGPCVVTGELRVRYSDLCHSLGCVVAALWGTPERRVRRHWGIRIERSLWLVLNLVLDHWHACVCWLDDIVILDGSEIEQGLFLNRFWRVLDLLGLISHIATLNIGSNNLLCLLAVADRLLNERSCLVNWLIRLHRSCSINLF